MLRFGDLLGQTLPNPTIQFIDGLARTPLSKVVWFLAGVTLLRIVLTALCNRFPEGEKDRPWPLFQRFFTEGLDAIAYATGVVFLLLRPFVIQSFYIPSESMVNTLLINDFILANKAIYRVSEPKFGDIVIFRPPNDAFKPGEPKQDFVKRLVGLPGDIVEIREGRLYRNGKPEIEPYVSSRMDADFKLVLEGDSVMPLLLWGDRCNFFEKRTAPRYMVDYNAVERQDRLVSSPTTPIPPGHYLMMGDNRFGSSDGRCWGLVPRASIIGRAECIFLPLNRMRWTR